MDTEVLAPPAFAIVVAADAGRGIGRELDLPWPKLPTDLAHFKRVTTQVQVPGRRNAVIMGRRTWDSVPPRYRPLSGRLNVVISRRPPTLPDGVLAAASLDDAIATALGAGCESLFVTGGGQLYTLALADPRCQLVYYTRIEGRFPCDTHFPPFEHGFERVAVDAPVSENGVTYAIERWRRRA